MNHSLEDLIRASTKQIKKAPKHKVAKTPRAAPRPLGILQRIKRKDKLDSDESQDQDTYEKMLAQEKRLESQSRLIRE